MYAIYSTIYYKKDDDILNIVCLMYVYYRGNVKNVHRSLIFYAHKIDTYVMLNTKV